MSRGAVPCTSATRKGELPAGRAGSLAAIFTSWGTRRVEKREGQLRRERDLIEREVRDEERYSRDAVFIR